MRASRTQSVGQKTKEMTMRPSRLNILGKDPNFDYCFRLKSEIEAGGGQDDYGYEAVGATNHAGESWSIPGALKTAGKRQMIYADTVLCKRPKEATRYFKQIEDEKYNAQKKFIRDSAKNTRIKLRELDHSAIVEDQITGDFTQRAGITEEVR